MKYLSVCSGIEAATVAWHPLGWEAVAYSEIERFPSEVLQHRYPDTPNWGDMTKFKEWPDADVDVFVGGTPCQSFSVAGLRKGLDDPRGNLMLTYLAIAKRYQPRWLVWENVPGVLSSNGGRDFGAFLGGLAVCGYGFAYRVLDAQYFGVAQRRKRVFVIGYLGDWHPAAAVLFERHSLSGHPAPSREKGKVAPTLTKEGTGVSRTGFNEEGWYVEASIKKWPAEISSTLDTTFGTKQGLEDQHVNAGCPMFVPAQPIALSDTSGRDKNENGSGWNDSGTAFTLDTSGLQGVAQPIPLNSMNCFRSPEADKSTGCGVGEAGEAMFTLTKGNSHAVAQPIPYDLHQVTSPVNSQNRKEGDPCHTLAKENAHNAGIVQKVYEMHGQDSRVRDLGDTCTTVTSKWGTGGGNVPVTIEPMVLMDQGGSVMNINTDGTTGTLRSETHGHEPVVMQQMAYNIAPGKGALKDDIHVTNADATKTLDASGSNPAMHQGGAAILQQMAVRRLTPVECERLQGFPDNYTDIKSKNKPTPDGPRYKALGNSMAVPVMAWIGKRIQEVTQCQQNT